MDTAPPSLEKLDLLESQSIYILREVAAECKKPALMFSGGKDSAVLLRLAEKAFHPAHLPFPLLHVDTGHNFPEVIAFRNKRIDELGATLIIASVQDSIDNKRVADPGIGGSRNRIQSVTLLDTIAAHHFDALIGGARRDEDPARAKERIFSIREASGRWDPSNQRPELWQLYNTKVAPKQHLRVFPISDWTELDIWHYIRQEQLELPNIYFAHTREVVRRNGMLLSISPFLALGDSEKSIQKIVRFRTVGDATCTAAILSKATTINEVIEEIGSSHISERGETRADDKFSEHAMEERKNEGYF